METVIAYEDNDYNGNSVRLAPGRYLMNELGVRNDSISSVSVPQGFRVTLFQDDNWAGRKLVLTESVASLPTFNDLTSGIWSKIVNK